MADLETRSQAAPGAPGPFERIEAVRETRIDPPHRIHNGVDEAAAAQQAGDAVGLASAVPSEEEFEPVSLKLVQQLRLQAQQLAGHLQNQQADLDRREAEMQAKLAQLEQHERNRRLWLKEAHDELSEREAELVRREEELAARARGLDVRETTLRELAQAGEEELLARREGLDRREAALREAQEGLRERDLEMREAEEGLADAASAHDQLVRELDERAAAFEARRSAMSEMLERFLRGELLVPARPNRGLRSLARSNQRGAALADDRAARGDGFLRDEFDELADALVELQARRDHLAEADTLLRRAESEVEELRQDLLRERTLFENQRQAERRELDEMRRRNELDLERRLQAIQAANDQLELRRAAVDQMRGELVTMERETLETRLAVEELIAQMSGGVPPAQLTHAIARSRSKIAEHYRLQSDELAAQRRELERLASQLAEQHDRTARHKRDIDEWLACRQAEIEQSAGRVAQREQQLDAMRDELEKLRFDWEHERREYQHEIRRLLAELGQ